MHYTARAAALRDIKESLKKEGKCFLAFRSDLNSIMEEIVDTYATLQDEETNSKNQ